MSGTVHTYCHSIPDFAPQYTGPEIPPAHQLASQSGIICTEIKLNLWKKKKLVSGDYGIGCMYIPCTYDFAPPVSLTYFYLRAVGLPVLFFASHEHLSLRAGDPIPSEEQAYAHDTDADGTPTRTI